IRRVTAGCLNTDSCWTLALAGSPGVAPGAGAGLGGTTKKTAVATTKSRAAIRANTARQPRAPAIAAAGQVDVTAPLVPATKSHKPNCACLCGGKLRRK